MSEKSVRSATTVIEETSAVALNRIGRKPQSR